MNLIKCTQQFYYELPKLAAACSLGPMEQVASAGLSKTTAFAARISLGSTLLAIGLGMNFYYLFDQGLANFLAVDTLKHGTSTINYIQIRFIGGRPRSGGKRTGSTKGFVPDDTRNYFYVFKDTEKSFAYPVGLNVRLHCFLSGYNFGVYNLGLAEEDSDRYQFGLFHAIKRIVRFFIGLLSGIIAVLITPTVNFRVRNTELKNWKFQNDPCYSGLAYRTREVMPPWRIGLLGTCISASYLDWYQRAKNNPTKVLTGVFQLAGAALLGAIIINGVATTALSAGAVGLGILLS